MYDWFYKELDLPHPPNWMIKNALDKLPDVYNVQDSLTKGLELDNLSNKKRLEKISNFNQANEQNALTRILYKNNKEEKHATLFHIEFDEQEQLWAKENISQQYTGVSLVWSFAGNNTLGAHTDKIRDYTLIYLLDPGGSNVETVFYHEEDKPLYRNNKEYSNDYSKLKRIGQIVIKEKTWTIINSRIMHGVENIESSRKAIQIGFKESYIQNTFFVKQLTEN